MKKDPQKSPNSLPALPLPKKAAASIWDVPLEVGQQQTPKELARVLQKTLQNMGPDIAADISRVLAPLKNRFAAQLQGGSIADAFTRFEEIQTSIMNGNPTFAATVPILLERTDAQRPEPIASGVLIRILDRTFLLTAAHVTDRQNEGVAVGFISGARRRSKHGRYVCLSSELPTNFFLISHC